MGFSTPVVRNRLILDLLRRAEEMEHVEGEVSMSPAPSHFELAATISTQPEAASREMSTVAKTGLIDRGGSRPVLRYTAALGVLAAQEG